jgi:hypothetical protein
MFARHLHRQELLLSAYLDDELAEPERARLVLHLSDCSACRRRLAELAAVADAIGPLAHVAPPDGFTAAVLARLTPRPVPVRRPRWVAAWAAAVVVVIVALAVLAIHTRAPVPERVVQKRPPVERKAVAVHAPAAAERPVPPVAVVPQPSPVTVTVRRSVGTRSAPRFTADSSASPAERGPGLDAVNGQVLVAYAVSSPLDKGEVYEQSGDFENALAAYQAVAESTPGPALLGVGRVAEQLGDMLTAAEIYERVAFASWEEPASTPAADNSGKEKDG